MVLQVGLALAFTLVFYRLLSPSAAYQDQKRAALAAITSAVLSLTCVFALHRIFVTPIVVGRQLEEDLRRTQQRIDVLETRMRPKLEIVFPAKTRPYYQELRTVLANNQTVIDRRFRVGIQNLSSETVRDVRVILESCEPATDAVFPGHALQVMGTSAGTERFDCAPAEKPTGCVDVVWDRIFKNPEGQTQFIWIAYASLADKMLPSGTYTMRLRAEGHNTSCTKTLLIEKDRHQYTFDVRVIPDDDNTRLIPEK